MGLLLFGSKVAADTCGACKYMPVIPPGEHQDGKLAKPVRSSYLEF